MQKAECEKIKKWETPFWKVPGGAWRRGIPDAASGRPAAAAGCYRSSRRDSAACVRYRCGK